METVRSEDRKYVPLWLMVKLLVVPDSVQALLRSVEASARLLTHAGSFSGEPSTAVVSSLLASRSVVAIAATAFAPADSPESSD